MEFMKYAFKLISFFLMFLKRERKRDGDGYNTYRYMELYMNMNVMWNE